LYNKNANKSHEVASLTKMMGLILIFEAIEKDALKTDEVLTTSENAKNMGGSQIWLEIGEKISVDDLLKGIIMGSANDAMVLMAERVSGTEEAFVNQMNKKAKEFGLQNTYFKNSTGLDEDGAYSSAYDMAIIAKELIKYEKVFDYSKNYESYIRENTDNKTWITNTNKVVY
jgi:serine-type D-Ala-D-Ala carboxypeptidase (penicillin-binding protein 5/6)